ncbi:MAG: hypothetical protein JWP82_2590 [Humibacillus sp.]|nr:hypothetical protein [Humibacillus sp.]
MSPMPYAVRPAASRRSRAGSRAVRGLVALGVAALAAVALGACSSDTIELNDLPAGVASARPSITADEGEFVLAAGKLGVVITGATVDDDIETGTTTCWALKNGGGVTLGQIAVGDDDKPLPSTGDALRTKQLMAAGVQTFCPDYDDQVGQLKLP